MKDTHAQAQALAEKLIAELPKNLPIPLELRVKTIQAKAYRVLPNEAVPDDTPSHSVSVVFQVVPVDTDINAAAWMHTEATLAVDYNAEEVTAAKFVEMTAPFAAAQDLCMLSRCGARHYTDEEIGLQADEDDKAVDEAEGTAHDLNALFPPPHQ